MHTLRQWWTTPNKLILTSLACALAVGAVVVTETVLTPGGGPHLPWLWWSLYLLFFLDLLAIHGWLPGAPALSTNGRLVVLIVLAVVLTLLYPQAAWVAMLLVMTATMTSFFWPSRAVFALIVAQTLIVAVVGTIGGWPTVDFIVAIVVIGNFQVFGALVVFAVRGEAEARSELAVALAELRATAAVLEVTTREAERLRISRDLHDLAGHDLTALSLELEVAQHLAAGTEGGEHVVRARSIAKDLLGTVRTAVGKMRAQVPSLPDGLGQLAADVPGLTISLDVGGPVETGVDQTVAFLRCAQEAITNTLRHSSAEHMLITVSADAHGTCLTATDDGDGGAQVTPGLGLTGMAERFASLGGSLEITPGPDRGIAVVGWLPR